MRKQKHFLRATALCLIAALSLGLFGYAKEKSRGEQDYDRVVDAGKFFFAHYLDATPSDDPVKAWMIAAFEKDETLADSFINTMYQTWDPYSYYFTNETYEDAFDYSSNRVGIGINLEATSSGAVMVSAVQVGAPADKAGLEVGDIIRAVDGRSVAGYSVSMVGDLLRAPLGQTTKLKVLRNGRETTIAIVHAALPVSTVAARNHGGGVCYMRISYFDGTKTFMDFTTKYETLADDGYTTVILDLRDNPGGSLSSVSNILNYIIPDWNLPYLRQRLAAPAQMRTSVSDGLGWVENKLLILTNENTASSAEVLAGVLQDLGYAETVGTKTYGKGFAQQHLAIDNSHTAVISYSELLLPIRGSYDGVGILPDHPVNLYTTKYQCPALTPLNLSAGVSAKSSTNVRALEERLHELGHFEFSPDDTADFRTWHAVNQFQIAQELLQTEAYCDVKTVQAVHAAMETLIETPVVIDTQFQKALMLARAYAERGCPPTVPDPKEITFGTK